MWPTLFHIGPLTIYNYGLSLAIAALVCGWLLSKDALKHKLDKALIYDLMFYVVIFGIVGARIFYVLMAWDYYQGHLLEVFLITQGGLAWQGGFVSAVLTGIVFAYVRRVPLSLLFDLAAPYIALGQAIGRLGCFANGCCYGKPVAWGIYFPVHHARLHPTQLYEAGSLFLIFIVLKLMATRSVRPGMVFVGYLWLAALERFIVEFYRADQMVVLGNLSLFQWIALAVLMAGVIVFIISLRRQNVSK